MKKNLKMKAFYWMMMKTTSIPETGSGGYFFPDSQASTSRQFHVLVVIIAIYHIVASTQYANNLYFSATYSLKLK